MRTLNIIRTVFLLSVISLFLLFDANAASEIYDALVQSHSETNTDLSKENVKVELSKARRAEVILQQQATLSEPKTDLSKAEAEAKANDLFYSAIKEYEEFQCNSSIPYHCSSLSEQLRTGTKKDMEKGFYMAKNACDSNDYDSCSILGRYYLNGNYVKQSQEQAYEYFLKSAKGYSLIGLVDHETFRNRDYYEYIYNTVNACHPYNKDLSKCLTMDEMLFEKTQNENALKRAEKLCMINNIDACLFIVKGYRELNYTRKASKYAISMCKKGIGEGCGLAISIYEEKRNKNQSDENKVFSLAKKGCSLNDTTSCNYLTEHSKKTKEKKELRKSFNRINELFY